MDISSMLEVQVNEVREVDSKENVTPKDLVPSTTREPPPISQDESNFYRIMFGNDIASVRFRRLHCTACDVHIGSAPSQAHNMCEHPMLRVLLCAKCREFYGDGSFEQGDDATDMFCRWCANGGNLYCCSYCSNTFCYKCIRRNFDSLVRKKIEADEKWKCFVCNPADLYSARAVCWALLQHIQTVTRILHNDMKMSPEEVEEKMNLDEAQCCPRRQQKRSKKGRLGSRTSEDEDETYVPGGNGMPIVTKRKMAQKIQYKKRLKDRSHVYDITTPKSPYVVTQYALSNDEDTSESFGNEQSCEGDGTSVALDSESRTVISEERDDSMPSRFTLDIPVQVPQYCKSIISPVPTANLLQRPPPVNSVRPTLPSHSAILPPPPLANSTIRPDIRPCYSSAPMVTIPNSQPNMVKRARVLLPRRRAAMMVTPNIIDLDSDSDEPIVVDTNKDNNVDVRKRSSAPMPVALVSSGITNDMEKDQPLRELCTTLEKTVKTFTESILFPQSREIETVIRNLKVKFYKLYEDAKKESSKQNEMEKALVKVKQFYSEIRNTIIQLANINDKVVREYNCWKRSKQMQEDNEVCDRNRGRRKRPASSIEIPLDMTCINDSAPESDLSEDIDDKIIEPSEVLESTNVLEDILFHKRKNKTECAVGDHSVLYEDKSVQAYNVSYKDYEKSIGYSLLMKAKYNTETESNEFEPVVVPNEHFGKYQEQFIYYLQHIEDHGISMEGISEGTVDDVSDPNEVDSISSDVITVEEIITEEIVTEENTSALIPEVLENKNVSVTVNPSEPSENDKEDTTDTSNSQVTSNVTSTAVEQLVKMVNELANNLSDNENPGTRSDNTKKETDTDWQEKYSKEETVIAVKALDELLNKQEGTVKNSPNLINNKSCTENEEDCTIIDD